MGKELWQWILETLRTDLVPIFTFKLWILGQVIWGCCWSVVNSCLNFSTCGMTGFPVLHHLPEIVQTQAHWSLWCYPTISSSVVPFSCLQSFQHQVFSSVSALHNRWPKYWSFSFSISCSMNIQGWFPLGWTDLTSLQSKGFSRVFSSTTTLKHTSSVLNHFYGPTLTSVHDYWKNHSFD